MSEINLPPGPKDNKIIGSYLDFSKYNLLDYATKVTKMFGDIVHIKLGPKHIVFLSNPEDVHRVLINEKKKYDKAKAPYIELIASDSLNTLASTKEWREKATAFRMSLQNITLDKHEQTLKSQLDEVYKQWETKLPGKVNISIDAMRITYGIMEQLMLHVDPHHYDVTEINKYKYNIVVNAINRETSLVNLPIFLDKELTESISYKYDLIKRIVDEYLLHPDESSYIGTVLKKYDIKEPPSMEMIKKITGEIMNALYLGSDPSDKLIAWTFYYLSMYPLEKEKIFKEIDQVAKGKEVSFSEIRNFPHASRFIKEVLRLRTPYALIARDALEEDKMRGYTIPKGSLCIIAPLLLHKHPEYWKNPEAFNPDRFKDIAEDYMAYIPFSKGARPCIGQQFAYRQSIYILIRTLQKYDFQLDPYQDYNIRFLGVLGCQSNIQGTILRREKHYS